MTDYTIEGFCDLHDACHDWRRWALKNCESVRDAWERLPHNFLLWAATRPGVLTDKELRLFAVFCARQVQHMMTDPRSIAAIDVAERFAHGDASSEELAAAWAASDAASGAAWAAASDAAKDAQSAWLRANTTPNFSKPGEKP